MPVAEHIALVYLAQHRVRQAHGGRLHLGGSGSLGPETLWRDACCREQGLIQGAPFTSSDREGPVALLDCTVAAATRCSLAWAAALASGRKRCHRCVGRAPRQAMALLERLVRLAHRSVALQMRNISERHKKCDWRRLRRPVWLHCVCRTIVHVDYT